MTPEPDDPLWMPRDEDVEAMRVVMAAEPELTDFGFGVYRDARQTDAERRQRFEDDRAALLDPRALNGFVRARDWLARQARTKGLNQYGTSYGLKHVAAHSAGYVTNGVFIAAALAEGFKVKRTGPNAYLNISKRAWTSPA